MSRVPLTALKIVGAWALGGVVMALGLLLLSLVDPVSRLSRYFGMGLAVAAFASIGLVAAARYIYWESRRNWIIANRGWTRPHIGGEPVFEGTRISVRFVGERARNGEPVAELLEDYPVLTHEDIEFAKMYVALGRPPGRPRKRPRFVRG